MTATSFILNSSGKTWFYSPTGKADFFFLFKKRFQLQERHAGVVKVCLGVN